MTKPSPPSTRRPTRPAARNRGSVYLAVLGAAMLVALIGVSGILVNRLQLRTTGAGHDAVAAGLLARSAVELAMQEMRDTSVSAARNAGAVGRTLGSGAITYQIESRGSGRFTITGWGEVASSDGSLTARRGCAVDLKQDGSGYRVVAGSWRQVVE